jgi:hypothetical protein
MSTIISETLKNKLTSIENKRKVLWDKLNGRYISEVAIIREKFSEIINKYGIMSQEAKEYAFKNAKKEQILLKTARYVNKNSEKILNEIIKLDLQINELANEISLLSIKQN